MKKILFICFIFFIPFNSIKACGWYNPNSSYYSLFLQEIIDDPVYYPFLLAPYQSYYRTNEKFTIKNENIEAWQHYLDINYDQAYYLVYKAAKSTLDQLLKNEKSNDQNLDFINRSFVKKYHQALDYLSYAKYLAPNMYIKGASQSSYQWGNDSIKSNEKLDYDKVIKHLKKGWKSAKDQKLKLRYGYQLVRYAHYNLQFQQAIDFFDLYVKPIGNKSIIYYYAVDQKGGAERGLGNNAAANYDFLQLFEHTKNRKESAYNSIYLTGKIDLEELRKSAKNDFERNEIDLLLGFRSFNNPLAVLDSIMNRNPNAVQAKVLVARAVNQLERKFLLSSHNCNSCSYKQGGKRLPISTEQNAHVFLNEAIKKVKDQLHRKNIKPNFWRLTLGYLYFIQKDYIKASKYISKVKPENDKYKSQKGQMKMLIMISQQKKLDNSFEENLMNQYGQYLKENMKNKHLYFNSTKTIDFIKDILANRYFLQNEWGKSFLVQNKIEALEQRPNLKILTSIEHLYYKKNKSKFEQFIIQRFKNKKDFDFANYVARMRGTLALRNNRLEEAKQYFDQTDKFPYGKISSLILGSKRRVCFSCSDNYSVNSDYIDDFSFIPSSFNKKEMTDVLIHLQNIASKGTGNRSAKAYYLLSNFYFNTSKMGYYRQILTFDNSNAYGPKFHKNYYISLENYQLYYKNYTFYPHYHDQFSIPIDYIKKGIADAKDDELKAHLYYTEAQCLQGKFDQDYNKVREDAKTYLGKNASYKEIGKRIKQIKREKYRRSFKSLETLSNTKTYASIKHNCLYFKYYLTQ